MQALARADSVKNLIGHTLDTRAAVKNTKKFSDPEITVIN
jgi:hypothetical protein